MKHEINKNKVKSKSSIPNYLKNTKSKENLIKSKNYSKEKENNKLSLKANTSEGIFFIIKENSDIILKKSSSINVNDVIDDRKINEIQENIKEFLKNYEILNNQKKVYLKIN